MNAKLDCLPNVEIPGDEVLSVPLPADMVAALRVAVFQRRSLGDEAATLANLVQDAVSEWLVRETEGEVELPISA